jgi:saccharopepsin
LSPTDYTLDIGGICLSGIAGVDLPPSLGSIIILGDVFLRRYFSVFDFEKSAVGLATSI